jgi:sugar phosphate isomerase/epimerase
MRPADVGSGRPRVIVSTTSHKREPLLMTLEVFGRLGLRDVDLNLHHIIEDGVPVGAVAGACSSHSIRLWIVSGGWCDFFDAAPDVHRTFASVGRQVEIATTLGVSAIRLFFGRLHFEAYSAAKRDTVCANLVRLSDAHPEIMFVFENHDGASLHPEVCAEILGRVARSNIRMNFDPINFAKAGVDPSAALDAVRPFVSHVHLKGLSQGAYVEFGEGDVDLAPVIHSLLSGGYGGQFTVEYEGDRVGTLLLYQSAQRARHAVGTGQHA